MTHASSIAQQDQGFFNDVVYRSIKCGIIELPTNWKGERPQTREVYYVPGSRCWCCFSFGGGGRSRNDQGGLILAIVVLVFGFFVGLSYTLESLKYENQAKQDLDALNQKKQRQFTPMTPQYQAFQGSYPTPSAPQPYSPQMSSPPPYTPPHQGAYLSAPVYVPYNAQPPFSAANPYSQGQPDLTPPPYSPLYPSLSPQQNAAPNAPPATQTSSTPVLTSQQAFLDAEVLLKGQKDKMSKLAFSQGILTIGAGLVTTALLIMLITETNFTATGLGTSGLAVLFIGGVYYVVQKSSLDNKHNEQAAANRISLALYPTSQNF